jgi:hypothetical protein
VTFYTLPVEVFRPGRPHILPRLAAPGPLESTGSHLILPTLCLGSVRPLGLPDEMAWPVELNTYGEVCGSERLTGAILDRLTHRVHILEANCESYRLRDSRRRLKARKA